MMTYDDFGFANITFLNHHNSAGPSTLLFRFLYVIKKQWMTVDNLHKFHKIFLEISFN